MKNKLGWALAILVTGALTLGATGCGSDDGGGGGGDTAKSSCETFCNKEKDCNTNTTVADCIMYSCSDIEKASAGCQSALKAFYDCMNKATNVCDSASCAAQETAYHDAC
ncbi:MAG TPA: hypothetical protein VFQ35_17775 [Polyangiaceae bacterium]|nr:hypothetical protein [Polyangiaceae bacterium]